MESFRRARTSYDFCGDMPNDSYFERMTSCVPLGGAATPGMIRPSSPGGPSPRLSRPRTRAAVTPRISSFEAAEMPMLSTKEDDNPFTGNMDPVNRQYYYRQWRQQPPSPRRPIYRSGRLGSPWRHIKSCVNNGGSHLVFIDGTVKTEENFLYPPEEMMQPPDLSLFISPRIATQVTKRGSLTTSFNDRAKQGFKYWYNEPKPINLTSRFWMKAKMLNYGP